MRHIGVRVGQWGDITTGQGVCDGDFMNQERFRFRSDMALGDLRPDFLCIGQPYAGTAWLHGLLSGHAQLQLPRGGSELDYFCFNYHRGENWYLEQFAGSPGSIRRVGEVGSKYIYSDLAASRIAAFRSIRRFIVTLRDPMEHD